MRSFCPIGRRQSRCWRLLPFVHVIDMTAYPMLVNFTEINGGPEPVNTTTGGYYNGEREHLRYAWNREIIKRALDQVM